MIIKSLHLHVCFQLMTWFCHLVTAQVNSTATPSVALKAPVELCITEEPICFSLQDFGTELQFVIKYPQSFGWVGLGTGLWMVGSDMFVVWQNKADSTFSLSSRVANANLEPLAKKAQLATIVTEESKVTGDKVQVTFRRVKDTGVKTDVVIDDLVKNFIWAYAKESPSSNLPTATLELHDNFGKFALDLSSGESIGLGGGIRSTANLVHGVLLFLGWNIIPYFGVLAAGPFRKRLGKSWFKVHVAMLGFLSPLLVTVGVGLAIGMAQTAHFSNPHEILGIFVFILMFIQIALGIVIDRLWDPSRISVPWYDKLHWWLGRSLFILAQVNIALGLITWDPSFDNLIVIWILWIIVLVLEVGLLVAIKVLPKRVEGLRRVLMNESYSQNAVLSKELN